MNPTHDKNNSSVLIPLYILALIALFFALYHASAFFIWVTCCFFLLALFDPYITRLTDLKVPAVFASLILVTAGVTILGLIVALFSYVGADIFSHWAEYVVKIKALSIETQKHLGILKSLDSPMPSSALPPMQMAAEPTSQKVISFLTGSMGKVLSAGGLIALVPVLTIFLVLERSIFSRFLNSTWGDTIDLESAWNEIVRATRAFFVGNLILCGISAAFFLPLFLLFHVKDAFVLSLASGFLNQFPFLGAFFAAFFPVLQLLHQGAPIGSSFFLLLGCGTVHFIVANLFTPKIIGSKLELNASVSTLSLIGWGYLWGPVGLILAIPMMATVKILFQFSNHDTLRKIAVGMSDEVNSPIRLRWRREVDPLLSIHGKEKVKMRDNKN